MPSVVSARPIAYKLDMICGGCGSRDYIFRNRAADSESWPYRCFLCHPPTADEMRSGQIPAAAIRKLDAAKPGYNYVVAKGTLLLMLVVTLLIGIVTGAAAMGLALA